MKTGIELISEERQRQIEVEGWTPEHDAGHDDSELVDAALCYGATAANDPGSEFSGSHPYAWPWAREWWKPSPDPIRNLTKAGALIAAEIDRLQRQADHSLPPDTQATT